MQPLEGALRLTVCDGVNPASFAALTNAASDILCSRQEIVHTNLSCHLIDCDSRLEERVKPFEVSP